VTLKQAYAQCLFQFFDLLADGSLRTVQYMGGTGEACAIGNRNKGFQAFWIK